MRYVPNSIREQQKKLREEAGKAYGNNSSMDRDEALEVCEAN